MKFLFACEYYHPSRGGVQEVMRQIAEHLVKFGHDVTVATTRLTERETLVLNGVHIEEFDISGNFVSGLRGEMERYQNFLVNFPADAVLFKAAQQWTFDASWPVLDKIRARKIFIPCGFSGFYLPQFAGYFREMPAILEKFDQLIFYAESYRDIDFARERGLNRFTLLSNGASEEEFSVPIDKTFRARLSIAENDFLLLTVGTPVNAKGHLEVAKAFSKIDLHGRTASLILNGQWPQPALPPSEPLQSVQSQQPQEISAKRPNLFSRGYSHLQRDGGSVFLSILKVWMHGRWLHGASLFKRQLQRMRHESARSFVRFMATLKVKMELPKQPLVTLDDWVAAATAQPGKSVIKTNLPRGELVQAFLQADLFVFASHVEYSPLVLFEAAAAGTPFLTVPAGNAEEIIAATKGGVLCPAEKDKFGYVRTDETTLAIAIEQLLADEKLRISLGEAGRKAWLETYNWAKIARKYEAILTGASDMAQAS